MEATCESPDISGWKPAPPPRQTPAPEEPTPEPPPAAVEPAAPRIRASWAGELLSLDGDAKAQLRRAAVGVGLASLYGVALGVRDGGTSILVHAVGVPAAIVAVTALGLPALYILLSLFDAPLSLGRAASAAARGVASAGLALAGLAPLCALYVVTSASRDGAALAGAAGLALGGALGLRHLVQTLREALREADSATQLLAAGAQLGFAAFAVLLACRVWAGLLPLIGGVS